MKRKFSLLLSLALIASFLVPSSPVFAGGWVSPTGFSDPDSKWSDEAKAYDDSTATFANHATNTGPGVWGSFIEFTHAELTASGVRVWVFTYGSTWSIDVDIYYGGAWHHVYEGARSSASQFVTYSFGSNIAITAFRVRLGNNPSWNTPRILEVDFNEIVIIAPTVTTQAVSDIAPTTATGNGNITATGEEDASAWGVCWNTGGTPTTADSKAAGTGSGGTGAFTASMTSLTAGTKYYVRAYATNAADTSYGSEVEFVYAVPTVTTSDATLTEETTATLNGEVSGGTLPFTERGFEWDIDSGAPYASSWSESAVYGVEAFSHGVTNLSEGTLYYCRAYAINSVGTGYGAEKTFLTKPLAPTSFTATTDVADVDLAWTKGTGAVNTVIRYQLNSYPADIAGGAQVYNNTGTAYTHLDPGSGTHYYRAWSYVTNGGLEQYSDAYAEDNAYIEPGLALWFQPNAMISGTALIDRAGTQNGIIAWGCNDDLTIVIGDTTTSATTTAAGEIGETGMITSAGQPEDWYATGTTIENLPFYAQFNIAATAMEMPTQTLYLIMMLGIATAIGLSVLLFTGSTLIAAIATGATILIEVGTTIIGMWMVYVFAILGVGILYLSRQT